MSAKQNEVVRWIIFLLFTCRTTVTCSIIHGNRVNLGHRLPFFILVYYHLSKNKRFIITIAALAQLDRATGFEPVGREFESLTPRHFSIISLKEFLPL